MHVGKSRRFGMVRGEQGYEIFRLLERGEAKSKSNRRYERGM